MPCSAVAARWTRRRCCGRLWRGCRSTCTTPPHRQGKPGSTCGTTPTPASPCWTTASKTWRSCGVCPALTAHPGPAGFEAGGPGWCWELGLQRLQEDITLLGLARLLAGVGRRRGRRRVFSLARHDVPSQPSTRTTPPPPSAPFSDLEVVMVNGLSPFGNGHLLPRGTLRELPKQALRRADALVLHNVDLLGGPGMLAACLPCSGFGRLLRRKVPLCSSWRAARALNQYAACLSRRCLPPSGCCRRRAGPERREAVERQLTSVAPRHTIFLQTQMTPTGLRSLIPPTGSLGARALPAWASWRQRRTPWRFRLQAWSPAALHSVALAPVRSPHAA